METARFAALCAPSGEDMPHPDPPPARLEVIVAALNAGWHRVQAHLAAHGQQMSALEEDQITTLLIIALNHLLADETVPGFTDEFFTVARDPKVVNYDGKHPDKMPDLVFFLRAAQPGLSANDGLHVECKPVGRKHGHLPYRSREGMGCFIHGDYGCKTTLGLMVAYADPGYEFGNKILPALTADFGHALDLHATTLLPAAGIDPPVSSHRRAWHYANGRTPGDIRLLHVWLTR